MKKKKHVLGSDLAKVDAHVIQPEEYEEIPELTDEWFEHANVYFGGKLIKRGRPKKEKPKVPTTIRFDADLLEKFRATGRGWQSRINQALREWVDDHPAI